jgi:hypothetical protein
MFFPSLCTEAVFHCIFFVGFDLGCHNPNIGFVIKCGMQERMKQREYVWEQNKPSQMGENARK